MKKTPDSILARSSSSMVAQEVNGWCDACGGYGPFEYRPVITSALAREWKLTKLQREGMSARESMFCGFCGCSYRLRLLARGINYWVNGGIQKSLLQSIEMGDFNQISVAEINSCGVLHDTLRKIPHLTYSEYGSNDPKIPDEDLQQLSYKDNMFDLVLTSDVLEHVPNVKQALEETFRVLKPGGAHIMSVPIIRGRLSRTRTRIGKDQSVVHTLPASFHGSGEPDYLVWSEFGDDFVDMAKEVGFQAYELFVNEKNSNDPSGIILAIKPGGKKSSSKALIGHIYDNTGELIDRKWQAERVMSLIKKQKLSDNHIHNLESMLKGYKDEHDKVHALLEEYRQRIAEYETPYSKRLLRRIKAVIDKTV